MGKINKKAVFFTFIAISIMTVFVLVFTPQSDISLQKDTKALETRIFNIDSYVSDLEGRYFEDVLRVSSYRAVTSLIFYINTTGAYLTDLDANFREVVINGTINKVQIDSVTNKKIMENSTLTNWSNVVIKVAKDTLNVNTTIIVNNVSLYQINPWEINSIADINISVKSNVAEWSKKSVVVTSISIEGLHDPYYLVNTNKEYTNRIKRSTVAYSKWNISIVREHLRNGTYVHLQGSNAPDFLMRFTNTLKNSSCCGIESLVNPNKISPSDRQKSYVDYMLWNPSITVPCDQIYNITKPPTSNGLWDEFRYFKLDLNHTLLYNITDADSVKNCQ